MLKSEFTGDIETFIKKYKVIFACVPSLTDVETTDEIEIENDNLKTNSRKFFPQKAIGSTF